MRILPYLLLIVGLAACDFGDQQETGTAAGLSLFDHDWRLAIVFREDRAPIAIHPDIAYTAQFSEDGNVSGQASCNAYSGTYILLEEGSLQLDANISSTFALCNSTEDNDFDFLSTLISVSRYDTDSTTLVLSFGTEGRLVFYPS